MAFTEAARTLFLDKMFRNIGSGYINSVSLHTADPGTTGANEVVGTGYARKFTAFTSNSSNSLMSWENTSDTSWGTITHVGLWSSTGPVYFGSAALSVAKAAIPGSIVSIPIGDLDITATGLTSTGRSRLMMVAVSLNKFTVGTIRLHTGDPADDGLDNRLDGTLAPGYAEAIVTWNPASGATITNSDKPLWANNSGSAWPTVTHWSAVSSGLALAKGALTTPIALATGDMMEFPVGSISVSVT